MHAYACLHEVVCIAFYVSSDLFAFNAGAKAAGSAPFEHEAEAGGE
jgi:hypothetical protein